MKINQTIEQESEGNTAVALGFFDGVHLAHQKIINTTVSYRKTSDLIPTVFTFKMDSTIPNKRNVQFILSDQSKLEVFERHGVEQVYIPPFSELVELSSTEFFYEVLIKKLKAKVIVCGFDYTYGKGATGNTDELMELCIQNKIELIVMNPMKADNMIVSSTAIRQGLEAGNIKLVNRLLGASYFIKGTVSHGNHLGKKLGFPTANIAFEKDQIVPKFGVYSTVVYIGSKIYRGLTNVGVKPTIEGERAPLAETYIVGLNEDIYGQVVALSFVSMIRDEKKFDSIDALKRAMQEDLKYYNIKEKES